jgi:class 3 adenylate cyclase
MVYFDRAAVFSKSVLPRPLAAFGSVHRPERRFVCELGDRILDPAPDRYAVVIVVTPGIFIDRLVEVSSQLNSASRSRGPGMRVLENISRAGTVVIELMAPALFEEVKRRNDIARAALAPLLRIIAEGLRGNRDARRWLRAIRILSASLPDPAISFAKLSLFPSRFAQRDPHPHVGPGVRIRFPPAASLANSNHQCRPAVHRSHKGTSSGHGTAPLRCRLSDTTRPSFRTSCRRRTLAMSSSGLAATLVTVLNRYLSVMSDPVRRHNGIIDKYIGDAIMAFWGPPFTGADEQARLACLAALDQLTGLTAFRAELPDLMGLKRGFPEIDLRIGVATGDVVVGSIGSEQTRNYTVIGDTVNLASRLEGANKTYGTRVLISEATNRLAADAVETREIDAVLVVGKTEPQRIFELLGRKGEVTSERLALRDASVEALDAYRRGAWEEARIGFEACLAIHPCDPPSKVFLGRIAQFRTTAPCTSWNGVWSLVEK